MGKFSRTWRIMGASWRVLKQDKELLLFPLLSILAGALVLASFVAPLLHGGTRQYLAAAGDSDPLVYAWAFLFYLVSYFVMIFFNAAIVACALKRMEGGDPTLTYGLRAAWGRLPQLLGWALVTGTVGFILRLIEERVGLAGRIAVALLGLTWTVTAYLVVPLLVTEGRGPVRAYKSSVALLKRTWGEQIIGNVSFGLIFLALAVVPVALVILLAGLAGSEAAAIAGVVVIGGFLLVLALVQSTLQAIYQAAIYRYAREGTAPPGFEEPVLAGAFRERR